MAGDLRNDVLAAHKAELRACADTEARLACLQAYLSKLDPAEKPHHWWQRK